MTGEPAQIPTNPIDWLARAALLCIEIVAERHWRSRDRSVLRDEEQSIRIFTVLPKN